MSTANSPYVERDLAHVWHPCTQMKDHEQLPPIPIRRAQGAWLEDFAEKNGVGRHVHFLSGLHNAELAACYAACEIFALPSRGEGFGLVYLEAMACGKPVIGGMHGGAPELIQDGVTGYLVPHGDPIQLATALQTLLADPQHAKEMGARGRQTVDHEYRFPNFAKALKKILRAQC